MEKTILLIIAAFLLVNCSTPLKVTKKAEFNTNGSITVVARSYDPLNIQPELEHLLLTKGLNIVSESTAQRKVKYQQEIRTQSNKISNEGEVGSAKEISSVYALTFQYTTNHDVWLGNEVFDDFNATIVRMSDGQVVASTSYSQSSGSAKSPDKVIESFVNKLVNQ